MGVLDGQAVNQSITNPAFINKNTDDVMPNKLGFNRALSGASIADIQAAVNKLYTCTGSSESTTGTVYSAPSNTISDGDSHQTALTKLANKFDPATGHTHTGAAGDAPPILGSSIASVPLMGFIQPGTTLTSVTGYSSDVSSAFVGKNASSTSTTLGVVVDSGHNKVRLLEATGAGAYHELLDTSGNLIYGRLTATAPTGGTWTLSYYSEVSGTETPYSFSSATDLLYWYQELQAPLVSTAVYNPTMDLFGPATGGGGSGSGGGGGGSLIWIEGVNSATPLFENSLEVYGFDQGLSQALYTSVKVPNSYTAGNPIKMRSEFYSPDSSGNVLFQTVTTLIRAGTDTISSTTNQRTSTNSAVTLGAGTVNIPQSVTFDLTSSSGQINSVSVSPNDILIIQLLRGSDTATSTARHMVYSSEVSFS